MSVRSKGREQRCVLVSMTRSFPSRSITGVLVIQYMSPYLETTPSEVDGHQSNAADHGQV